MQGEVGTGIVRFDGLQVHRNQLDGYYKFEGSRKELLCHVDTSELEPAHSYGWTAEPGLPVNDIRTERHPRPEQERRRNSSTSMCSTDPLQRAESPGLPGLSACARIRFMARSKSRSPVRWFHCLPGRCRTPAGVPLTSADRCASKTGAREPRHHVAIYQQFDCPDAHLVFTCASNTIGSPTQSSAVGRREDLNLGRPVVHRDCTDAVCSVHPAPRRPAATSGVHPCPRIHSQFAGSHGARPVLTDLNPFVRVEPSPTCNR